MRVDFRIKVDLSEIYQDARQFNLVYIDSTKIWHVSQLKEHLIILFNLKEPFHLMSTGKTYLPPEEDIRILNQNDVVIVLPGTGLLNAVNKAEDLSVSLKQNGCTKSENNGTVVNNESVINVIPSVKRDHVSTTENAINFMTFPSDITAGNATLYHSIIDEKEIDSDSKVTDCNTTLEDCDISEQNVLRTRKRVRRKKSKKDQQLPDREANESLHKKPKIINNVVIPSGKHIRFNAPEIEKVTSDSEKMDLVEEELKTLSTFKKATPAKSLDALLALGQTSTPLTFSCRKITQEVKFAPQISNVTVSEAELKKEKLVETSDENANKLKIGDIVEFKMLKIGEDYTPTVSNFITAQITNYSNESSEYTLKITKGKEETTIPIGKFSLPKDEMPMNDESTILRLTRTQFIDLRVIKFAA